MVVATDKASPSSESNRSAGGCSFKMPVGLEMVVDVTGVKGVKLGEFGVRIDLYKTSAEAEVVVTRAAPGIEPLLARVMDTF